MVFNHSVPTCVQHYQMECFEFDILFVFKLGLGSGNQVASILSWNLRTNCYINDHQCININPKLCTSVSMRNLMSNFTGKSKMFMLHFTFCFWLHRCAAASMAEWSTDWFPFHQGQAALLRERTPDNRLRVHGCRGRHLWTLQWWG